MVAEVFIGPDGDGSGGGAGGGEAAAISLADALALGASSPAQAQQFVRVMLGGWPIWATIQPDNEVLLHLGDLGVQKLRAGFTSAGFVVDNGRFTDFTAAGPALEEGDPLSASYAERMYAPMFTGSAAGFTSATFTPGEAENISVDNGFFAMITWAWLDAALTTEEGFAGISSDIVGPPSAGSSLIGVTFESGDALDYMRFIWGGTGDGGTHQEVELPGARNGASAYALAFGWRRGFTNARATLFDRRTGVVLIDELPLTGFAPDELMAFQIAINSNNGALVRRAKIFYEGFIPLE